jgi:integrase
MTFAEYAQTWLTGYVAANLKPSTQEKYAEVLRKYWFPVIGHLPLRDITRAHIKTVLAGKIRQGMKFSTARLLSDVVKTCMNAAIEDELIGKNPAARAGKLLTGAQARRKVEALSRGVPAFLLQTAAEKMPEAYPIVLLLARTGMRLGEALALKRDDPDFIQRVIWVRRTRGSRNRVWGEARINTPKSGKERCVDMSQQLCQVLQAYLKARRDDSPWLFPARNRGPLPLNPNTFRPQFWKPSLDVSGLTYAHPHVLRHTYASMLIENGENLAYVRDQLGPSSIKITVDTYGHLVPGANKAAVDRLDDPWDVSYPYPGDLTRKRGVM